MSKYHKGYMWCEHCDEDSEEKSFRHKYCPDCGGLLSKSLDVTEIIEIVCTKVLNINPAEWDINWHGDNKNIHLFAEYINCSPEQIHELIDRCINIRGLSREEAKRKQSEVGFDNRFKRDLDLD